MSANETPAPRARTRSPAYPVIGLSKAVDLAGKLWQSIRKSDSHIDSALAAMGFARHGESLRIIAALSHYGLLDETGSGDARRVRLSERAQDIIHLEPDDPRKLAALKDAALTPVIHTALWDRYGRTLPTESSIRPFLIRDKGYNDSIVEDVINNYIDSFHVAGLGKLEEDNAKNERVEKVSGPPKADLKTATPWSFPGFPSTVATQLPSVPSQQELPILVGDNRHARIPFPMSEDDFDLLIGTLNLWKKKIIRTEVPPTSEIAMDFPGGHGAPHRPEAFPKQALWKNKDNDMPVTIVGIAGSHEGQLYYKSSTHTGIPASELIFEGLASQNLDDY